VGLAVVVGRPSEPGPYVIRVKVPAGVKLMPHKHPEDRIYTVMSGVFYIGLGERLDGDGVKAYPPGSVIVLPGDTWHFHWAKSGEYVIQVTAIGPLGLGYLNAYDDPRRRTTNRRDRIPPSIRPPITRFLPRSVVWNDDHADIFNQDHCVERALGRRASHGPRIWPGGIPLTPLIELGPSATGSTLAGYGQRTDFESNFGKP
jgi:hypothetical protein